MEYSEVPPCDIPRDLLLEADPSDQRIDAYLQDAWCFVAKQEDTLLGACVAAGERESSAEIFNIAVYPQFQQRGIGAGLLEHTLAALRGKNVRRVELGTGTFGHQLTLYQRIGFRVDGVWKDHFLENYPEPIFENGIQHRDMLRLYVDL